MNKRSKYIIKSSDLNIDTRTITGYASVFDEFDYSKDRILKGSFLVRFLSGVLMRRTR